MSRLFVLSTDYKGTQRLAGVFSNKTLLWEALVTVYGHPPDLVLEIKESDRTKVFSYQSLCSCLKNTSSAVVGSSDGEIVFRVMEINKNELKEYD